MRFAVGVAAVSLVIGVGPACCGADGPSLCQRLATRAGGLDQQAWADGSKALRPALEVDETKAPTKGFEADLARNPAIREATAAGDDGQWTVFVDHMHGSDLYAASTSQGTLHCQTYAFARAQPGGRVTLIDGPPSVAQADGDGPDGELCWTRTGNFGRVFGHPAFVEHGVNDQATDDEDIRITPWTNGRWTAACVLKLRFQPDFVIARRHCGDAAVCAAAEREVLDIAAAYHQKRQTRRDNTPFRYAGARSDKIPADVERVLQAGSHTLSPELPKFGDAGETNYFSYSGLYYFPLSLDGHIYVSAIGHEGVGWRETSITLFVIYTIKDGGLVPQAGYEIGRSIGGLKAATAD